jgi:hypothetical protein
VEIILPEFRAGNSLLALDRTIGTRRW